MMKSSKTASISIIRGSALGVQFMACFGSAWAYIGIVGLQGWDISKWLFTAAAMIGIVLFYGGVQLKRETRKFTVQMSNSEKESRRGVDVRFRIIFAVEILAIIIAVFACNRIHHTGLLPLLIALIVGIHFYPLGYLFQVKMYYVTGALLCLIAITLWLIVPNTVTFEDHRIQAYKTMAGFGSSLILWGTALRMWIKGKRLLSRRNQTAARNWF